MPINPHKEPQTTRVTAALGAATALVAANTRRTYLRFKNIGANPVWLGASTVTNGSAGATDGFKLSANETVEFWTQDAGSKAAGRAWYGNASVGASDVSILEIID